MAGNSFGKAFKITTFGESHGKAIGVVIDGCPAGLSLDLDFIQSELDRRKPAQSKITTQRKEEDKFKILSGVFNNTTTGTPITIIVNNQDQKSEDYDLLSDKYRPSHADYTYQVKYGFRDHRGGGRASARETVSRVIAGAIAKIFLKQKGIEITGYVSQIGNIKIEKDYNQLNFANIEKNIVRCPDIQKALEMILLVEEVRNDGDSIGGVISCVIKNMPMGLGEPVFDKLQADLAKAMLSINAVKGFEYGSGFRCATMRGSEHNDVFYKKEEKIFTRTNYSGGIQGGISNGEDIYFDVAFKPTPSIMKTQQTLDINNNEVEINVTGRHDPCIVPRAVPVVEAMSAIVIMDHYLRQKINL